MSATARLFMHGVDDTANAQLATAYTRGYMAGLDGKAPADCPYVKSYGSRGFRRQWFAGYTDGLRNREGVDKGTA